MAFAVGMILRESLRRLVAFGSVTLSLRMEGDELRAAARFRPPLDAPTIGDRPDQLRLAALLTTLKNSDDCPLKSPSAVSWRSSLQRRRIGHHSVESPRSEADPRADEFSRHGEDEAGLNQQD